MITIKNPTTREEFKEYYALRFDILRKPWSMAKGTEKDDYEPISQHFMAVDDRSGKIVGCVKLFEKEPGVGWFSHLAVAADYQHRGVGKLLMEAVESTAREKGFTTLGCMSRLNVTGYFEKMGYHIAGLPSHYFGTIQVAWMERKI